MHEKEKDEERLQEDKKRVTMKKLRKKKEWVLKNS